MEDKEKEKEKLGDWGKWKKKKENSREGGEEMESRTKIKIY